MKANNTLAVLVVIMLAGCDMTPAVLPLPEVTDENCTPERIKVMPDKGQQQEFSGLCLRRGGSFKASPKREW